MGRLVNCIYPISWFLVAILAWGLAPESATGQEGPTSSLRVGNIHAPTFSPSRRSLLSYERQLGDEQRLLLYDLEALEVRPISFSEEITAPGDDETVQGLLGQSDQQLSYAAGQLAWRPVLDAEGRQWFVFVVNAPGSGFSLYLSYVTPDGGLAGRAVELPFEGKVGMPEWSPDGRHLVFSGRSSASSRFNLYMYSNVERFFEGASADASPVLLTRGGINLHPSWSPDGDYIAYQSQDSIDGEGNSGIRLLDMTSWDGSGSGILPRMVRMSQSLGSQSEYKPTWSPDGQYLACYVTQGESGRDRENRRRDIAVLAPERGNGGRVEGGTVLRGYSGERVARNVLPNESRGPQWHPSSSQQSLAYVKKEEEAWNPIRMANLSQWLEEDPNFERLISEPFEGSARLHEEVSMTLVPEGLRMAFVAQAEGMPQLQVRNLSLGSAPQNEEALQIRRELSGGTALLRSALFPGLGQFYRGQQARGWLFAAAGGAALVAAAGGIVRHQRKVDDYNSFADEYLAEASPLEQQNQRLESLYDDATSARTVRNITLASLAGVWVVNLLDSAWGPGYTSQRVYTGSSMDVLAPRIEMETVGDQVAPKFSLRIRF